MRQPGVAQAGGEIERADHLRHADAGLARRARIAVGHVGGGFLAVGMDARDRGAPLHLDEAAPQHRRHHEHVGDAVFLEHVGEAFGAGHFAIVAKHLRLRCENVAPAFAARNEDRLWTQTTLALRERAPTRTIAVRPRGHVRIVVAVSRLVASVVSRTRCVSWRTDGCAKTPAGRCRGGCESRIPPDSGRARRRPFPDDCSP